jgi:hypothetical protein
LEWDFKTEEIHLTSTYLYKIISSKYLELSKSGKADQFDLELFQFSRASRIYKAATMSKDEKLIHSY